MKRFIWVFAIIISGLAIVFLSTLLILFYNQERITQSILTEINEEFVGYIVVKNSHVAPFANFPYISLSLDQVRFYPHQRQQLRPILSAEHIYVGFDFWDIVKGNLKLKNLKLSDGHLDIIQFANGETNILMALKPNQQSAAKESEKELAIDLTEAIIKNFQIKKIDVVSKRMFDVDIYNAISSFSQKDGQINISLQMDGDLDIFDDQVEYFLDKPLKIDAALHYSEEEGLLSVNKGRLDIEMASFYVEGFMETQDEYLIDLKLSGRKPDFNMVSAIAPIEIVEQLNLYKNEGQVYFDGTIKGSVAEFQSPHIEFSFGCENGYFINKQFNRKLDELAFKGYYTNGENNSLESSELRIENFQARPEQGIFRGNLIVRNFTDPFIAVSLNSELDLAFLGEFFGIDDLRSLKGQILLDMNFNELLDIDLPRQSMQKLKEGVQSELVIRNLSFDIPNYPHTIENLNAYALMDKGMVTLEHLMFKVGKSDILLSGMLSDLPAIFHKHDKRIIVGLVAQSNLIDFEDLIKGSTSNATVKEKISELALSMSFESSVEELTQFEFLPKGEFFINNLNAKLENYPHHFHDFAADMIITDSTFNLIDFKGVIDESDFHFTGALSNYPVWFREVTDGNSSFSFQLDSKLLRFNDLLTYEGVNYLPAEYKEEEVRDLIVNGKLDLVYNQNEFQVAKLLLYDLNGQFKMHPLKLRSFKGTVLYDSDKLQLAPISGKMGNSDFELELLHYHKKEQNVDKQNSVVLRSALLDVTELSNFGEADTMAHEEAWNVFELPFSNTLFEAYIGRFHMDKLDLSEMVVKGKMTEDHFIHLDTASLFAANGRIALSGYFNGTNPERIYFKSTAKMEKVDLEKLMLKFDNFGQDEVLSDNIQGQLSGTIHSYVHLHPDLVPIIGNSTATMDIEMKNGTLINFAPFMMLSDYFGDKNLTRVRFDTLSNTLELDKGTLQIPKMTINSSLGFIEVSGKQEIDNNFKMDYTIGVPWAMVTQVGAKALFKRNKNEINTDKEDDILYRDADRKVRFVNLRITGDADDFKVSLAKKGRGI